MRYTGSGYATTDPTAVSIQLLTVFGTAPLSAFIAYQIVKGDPTRYYWIIVLSTAELYGGYVAPLFSLLCFPPGPPKQKKPIKMCVRLFRWMTICPEWFTGSLALNISDALDIWVYLAVSLYSLTCFPLLWM